MLLVAFATLAVFAAAIYSEVDHYPEMYNAVANDAWAQEVSNPSKPRSAHFLADIVVGSVVFRALFAPRLPAMGLTGVVHARPIYPGRDRIPAPWPFRFLP